MYGVLTLYGVILGISTAEDASTRAIRLDTASDAYLLGPDLPTQHLFPCLVISLIQVISSRCTSFSNASMEYGALRTLYNASNYHRYYHTARASHQTPNSHRREHRATCIEPSTYPPSMNTSQLIHNSNSQVSTSGVARICDR